MKKMAVRLSTWMARKKARRISQLDREVPAETGIGSESPIRSRSEDRLRRADVAGRIASVLSELAPREGRVFAIRGGWGYGKSSLKNLVTENLENRSAGADWIDFNPWQWGNADTISRALFEQIALRLGGKHSPGSMKRARALRRYGRILTSAGQPLNDPGNTSLITTILTSGAVFAMASAVGLQRPAVASIAATLAILAVAFPALGRVLSFLGKDHSTESLDVVREDLEDRLRELDRPLVVFIDDIDRLEADQIRLLIRQVKANANLPNLIFVLIFQPNVVEVALNPVAGDDGRSFLEKIVQTNFDLPPVSASTVQRLFTEELSEIVGQHATSHNGFDQIRWGNISIGCIYPFLRNLRDSRRLLSSIAVHLPLHDSDDLLEVNILDFLLLETLRVFQPDIHGSIFRERDLFLQSNRTRLNSNSDDRTAVDAILALAPESQLKAVRESIKLLFPPLEWAFGGSHYDHNFFKGWDRDKRVCTPRYFSRYFELQTPEGEISEKRYARFIASTMQAASLKKEVAAIEADGLLTSLAARLDDSVESLPIEHAEVLVPAMFEIADKFAGTSRIEPFNSPWTHAWRALHWYLKRIPQGQRGHLALDSFRNTEALSVASILMQLSDTSQIDGEQPAADPTFDESTTSEMRQEWIRIIRSKAESEDALLKDPNLLSLLYEWKRVPGAEDEPSSWTRNVIQSDQGFVKLIQAMMGRGSSHSAGDRVASTFVHFHAETVEKFIGIDTADNRIRSINPAEFPENQEALSALKKHVAEWLSARDH